MSTGVSVFTDVPYSVTPQRTLKLDLRIPAGGKGMPLVLYLPIGGFRVCEKSGARWWLVEHGFAMASIDIRVSSEAIAPAAVHDGKAAIRWLRAHASQYGYSADAIGVWGQSAGGLLASLLGTSGDVPELEGDGGTPGVSTRVQAVCDECGAPHDFEWFARPEIKQRFGPVVENLRLYLGGLVEERPALARLVSPQTYVTSKCPPVLMLHGDADDVVPVEETKNFHQMLRSAGVDSTLHVLPGIGHGWNTALTRPEIVAFFERTLRR